MSIEQLDVVIIGAGLSGVGAAAHLVRELPGKTYAVLESREDLGGTWDLFRYPGIRSDSDMYTFGYSFKPWSAPQAISDGPSIKQYIQETADEYGITPNIRYQHRVISASWSSSTARWTITAEDKGTGETVILTARWVIAATGYYRYDEGYRPTFPGEGKFRGDIVHPQHWPSDLNYIGKDVIVIGSGATAVTLLPALAEQARHVTMLQRTPTYIASVPGTEPLAGFAHKLLPKQSAYALLRWKNRMSRQLVYTMSRRKPEAVRAKLRKEAIKLLPHGYDVDTHFNPPYDPWDQRVCAVPDGDLFTAIRNGSASIVTGVINTFTADGITLEGGQQIPADIIITATGLALQWFGGIDLVVDGEPVNLGERFAYKGMMVSGVPNLSTVTGYTNNSWTLKADLVSAYACHLINYLDQHHLASATPVTPFGEPPLPFLDLDSGYIHRGIDGMAKQGTQVPWRLHQNYAKDVKLFDSRKLNDGFIDFQPRMSQSGTQQAARLAAPDPQVRIVAGRQIRYRDEGEGTPVLLVHGIGRSLEDWNEQHDLLRGHGYRVISLDLPGYGDSARLNEPYSLPALATAVGEFLDAIDVTEPAHLVGNSLGGAVAMQFAVQYPTRVRSLVLANSAGFGREAALPVRLMSVKPIGMKLLSKPSLKASRQLESSLFHDQAFVTDERIKLGYRLSSRPHAAEVFVETAAWLGTIRGTREEWRQDLLESLAPLRIPTLIVWGEEDRILPHTQLAAASKSLPHAWTQSFASTGHMPQIERAEDFAELITDFWADAPHQPESAHAHATN